MDWDDVKIPCSLMCEAERDAVLVYAMIRLHADADGRCDEAKWLCCAAGIPRQHLEDILTYLEAERYVERYTYDAMFGPSTGVRLLDWAATPAKHERITGSTWRRIRREVFERDNYTCAYCQAKFVDPHKLECDHVVPISKGGTNEKGNLVTACGPCNREKHGKVIELWRGRG